MTDPKHPSPNHPSIEDIYAESPSINMVVMDEKGNCLAIWRNLLEGAIHSVYKPLGQPWSAPALVASSVLYIDPVLAFDYAGNFVLIWSEMDKQKGVVWGSAFSTQDALWSKPTQLSPDGRLCAMPSIAMTNCVLLFSTEPPSNLSHSSNTVLIFRTVMLNDFRSTGFISYKALIVEWAHVSPMRFKIGKSALRSSRSC